MWRYVIIIKYENYALEIENLYPEADYNNVIQIFGNLINKV